MPRKATTDQLTKGPSFWPSEAGPSFRGDAVQRGTQRGGSAAYANNISPVPTRARAAWRMLGRGRRSASLDRESFEAAAKTAAAKAASRNSTATAAPPVAGTLPAKVIASVAAAADAAAEAGAASAPVVAEAVPAPFPELLRRTKGLHKPVGLVFASAHLLGTACALSGEFENW